jgi:Protein of unknown function (DUF998)
MTASLNEVTHSGSRPLAATLAAVLAIVTLLILALLHVMSPEFQPSWRMVSEYANGRHRWLLAAMFISWALSSWLLAPVLYPFAATWPAKLGVLFLVIAGIGEAMAAAFDINHPLHMHAAILGMNGLPIAALLIGISFARAGHWGASRRMMLWLSQLPWISVAVMSISMVLFFTGLSRAGIVITPDSKPLAELPAGVMAIGGWANRFLILSYCIWAIAATWCLRHRTIAKPR